jgi:hypothetical protein
MNHPAELPNPDDTGGGGGGRIRIPKEIPQELPVTVARDLVSQILLIRNRLNAFENAAIVARLGAWGGGIGGPAELPNPDDPGGGGFGGGEIPFEIPREIPFELPVDFESLIDSRISVLRGEILGQIAELKELIQKRG